MKCSFTQLYIVDVSRNLAMDALNWTKNTGLSYITVGQLMPLGLMMSKVLGFISRKKKMLCCSR
jgi:hypothetical protein